MSCEGRGRTRKGGLALVLIGFAVFTLLLVGKAGVGEAGTGPDGTQLGNGPYPDTPAGVEATDGAHEGAVLITWNAADYADEYRVYRGTVKVGAKEPICEWHMPDPCCQLWDDTAVPGRTYWYFVKARNPSGESSWSTPTTGWAKLGAATNVSASDGTYTDNVRVDWDSVSAAKKYRVYRAGKAGGTKRAVCDWQKSTGLDDQPPKPGKTYHYWLRTKNRWTKSDFSAPDTGWMLLAAPGNVQASDGTYAGKVAVAWDAVDGATKYRVYRAGKLGGTKRGVSDWEAGTAFNDTTARAGKTYHYWVRAKNAHRRSDLSAPDTGYRAD